jgi:Ca2+-binding RTX toxin-like protein
MPRSGLGALAPILLLLVLPAVAPAGGDPCSPRRSGEQCSPGGGRQTAGGGAKVSHKGWPAITGIFWKVVDDGGRRRAGTSDNDELLGHHGSDRIAGMGGKDVIWGDWNPSGNSTRQRDVLRGGDGNDFVYPSHGRTTVYGGRGNDYVWAFYGRGFIDCGPGDDTVRIRLGGAFKTRSCETVNHFCAHGSDGQGGCRKPGEQRGRAGRWPGASIAMPSATS